MTKKIFISLLLCVFSIGVSAVSEKKCLFSEMTGVVNFEGKPAAGVKLVRMVDYNKPQYDETVTDENGNFHFPAIYRSNIIGKFLPMQFVVNQKITAVKNDVEYLVWEATTMDSTANYEARGKPLVVSCELSLEEASYIKVNRNFIYSHCKWDVEPDQPLDSSRFDVEDDDEELFDDDEDEGEDEFDEDDDADDEESGAFVIQRSAKDGRGK